MPPLRRGRGASPAGATGEGASCQWLYGRHAGIAAAANPRRRIRRLVAIAAVASELAEAAGRAGVPRPSVETVERAALTALLPPQAVHQGLAVLADPLQEMTLAETLAACGNRVDGLVVVLDQAADPRNIGAVLRSAAAFGAAAVVVQDRHAPPATGSLAKAAAGALEAVPLVRVVNIARAVRELRAAGFHCFGLAAEADRSLAQSALRGPLAIVVGGEGAGLRRLVREACDQVLRIPIEPSSGSLNLSVAAAIALYEAVRQRQTGGGGGSG